VDWRDYTSDEHIWRLIWAYTGGVYSECERMMDMDVVLFEKFIHWRIGENEKIRREIERGK